MKHNMKICLPAYKIAYSVIFSMLLALSRGITDVGEIASVLEINMALLAAVFCADTWTQELQGGRHELFQLYPVRLKFKMIVQRLLIQFGYLFLLTAAAYWFYFWQKPYLPEGKSLAVLYVTAVLAVTASEIFFGSLSMIFADIFRGTWAGIGASLICWLVFFSSLGKKFPVWLNMFAMADGQRLDSPGNWIWGKLTALIASVLIILCSRHFLHKSINRACAAGRKDR